MVAAIDTFPVPSKLIGEPTISPVISKVLAFRSLIACVAIPADVA